MVESTALEMRRTGNRTVGSNPTLSASLRSRFAAGISVGRRLNAIISESRRVARTATVSSPVSGRGGGRFFSPCNTLRGPDAGI